MWYRKREIIWRHSGLGWMHESIHEHTWLFREFIIIGKFCFDGSIWHDGNGSSASYKLWGTDFVPYQRWKPKTDLNIVAEKRWPQGLLLSVKQTCFTVLHVGAWYKVKIYEKGIETDRIRYKLFILLQPPGQERMKQCGNCLNHIRRKSSDYQKRSWN